MKENEMEEMMECWFEKTDVDDYGVEYEGIEYEDEDIYILEDCAVIWSKDTKTV